MRIRWVILPIILFILGAGIALVEVSAQSSTVTFANDPISDNAAKMIQDGRQIFRFDTFGDEAFWGDTLQLHKAIEGSTLGGVGPGVSPKTALAVGLKVDARALPP